MYRHLLLPTDGSELAGRAVRAGIELAASIKARVTGLYVAPEHVDAASHAAATAGTPHDYLAVIESLARARGVSCELRILVDSDPGSAILSAAIINGCDLIFMAPNAGKNPHGLALGSNTHYVLVNSRVPVLVHR